MANICSLLVSKSLPIIEQTFYYIHEAIYIISLYSILNKLLVLLLHLLVQK